ncbi:MAG: hypothetical protein A2047_01940 [Omnitrophica bacterium GWA2_41_15]|nr:MAG: hypothetical protein A2047_01940 [Omnitrophica bacterium GWA2_41_15]
MSIEEAIIRVFKNKPNKIFAVQEIYSDFEEYYDLSDYQRQLDSNHPQPRFHHEIRSVLAKLEHDGIIIRIGRNERKLAKNT